MGLDLSRKIEEEGQTTVILQFPGVKIPENQPNAIALTDFSEHSLQKTLKAIEQLFGAIGGFIHTHPKAETATQINELFPETDREIVQSIFLMAKHLKHTLNNAAKADGKAYFVCATQVDGELGTSGRKAVSVLGSGLAGLVKSLNREWADISCKFIDMSPDLALDRASEAILEEMGDAVVEVGRSDTQRMTLSLEKAKAVLSNASEPNQSSVFLVTGGGRGITADCAIAVAQAYKSQFILLGRTPLEASEPEWASEVTDESDLKLNLLEYLRERGENLTPVRVNKLIKNVLSQREIRQTVAKISEFGGRAVYLSADITQAESLEKVLQTEMGITGIIHGAGNLADKRIEKKTLADWDSVFDAKIRGLQNILAAINIQKLQHLILFSSVSSYFGNAGQTDYALANEILNKFAYSFQILYPQLQVVSIDWGPWERGMMNPILRNLYREQGVDLIPASVGSKFCQEELRAHPTPQILISGNLSLPA